MLMHNPKIASPLSSVEVFFSFASVEKGGLDEGDVLMHHSK
jgi:hypothetical protein